MHARSLELELVRQQAVGAADIAARNTELRKLDLLPTGGRGLHAPEINAEHAAYMLLGLGSTIAAEAGRQAQKYAAFVRDGTGAETLVSRLAALLENPELANKIEEVRIGRSLPWVMIVPLTGSRGIYRPKKLAGYGTTRPKDYLTGGREEYVIGGGLLHQVAIDLQLDQGLD